MHVLVLKKNFKEGNFGAGTGATVGKILGMDFIDTDLVIQKREGTRLEHIIEQMEKEE